MSSEIDLHLARRRVLLQGGATLSALVLAPAAVLAEHSSAAAAEVSPVEDLMREHGVLRRLLLTYEEVVRRVRSSTLERVPRQALGDAAGLIKSFIEDYHEKLEEDYIFPAFENVGKMTDLTGVLRAQHAAGRRVTGQIQEMAASSQPDSAETIDKLDVTVRLFIRMYRPHAAREDTVLFPALSGVVGSSRYDEMGDQFEEQERKLFGAGGFETVVGKVAEIEKALGIYDLGQFTPKT